MWATKTPTVPHRHPPYGPANPPWTIALRSVSAQRASASYGLTPGPRSFSTPRSIILHNHCLGRVLSLCDATRACWRSSDGPLGERRLDITAVPTSLLFSFGYYFEHNKILFAITLTKNRLCFMSVITSVKNVRTRDLPSLRSPFVSLATNNGRDLQRRC